MLTVEHVKLRRKKGVVEVVARAGASVDEARALADDLVALAREHEGVTRAELDAALEEAPAPDGLERTRTALAKLVTDACEDADSDVDAVALRAEVFAAAARAREESAPFDRARVLAAIAHAHETDVETIERRLFCDLKEAQRVKTALVPDAGPLVAQLEVAEVQAVLLRATRVRFDVDGTPSAIRGLLRALKLHQLLFDVTFSETGLVVDVEGPMGMFQQSAKYGLKLALLLPHALACARCRVEADVRVRRHGASEPFVFTHARAHDVAAARAVVGEALPDHIEELRAALDKQAGPWRPRVALDLLKLPGEGAFVPDLALENESTGELVYVEVLGFWSRAAVWKRVELVERGLPFRVVFCVSDRLRVSEAALPEDAPAALLTYKGTISAARLLERVARAAGSTRVAGV
jgi:predicted nuclease of restriction endonuclease-like RecB superfamily